MPYTASDANAKTRKANTGKRSRQWVAVYESSIARGDDEGVAITKANGVVKKNWKRTNPSGRSPRDHRPQTMKVAECSGFLAAAGCSPEQLRKQLLGQAPVNEAAIAAAIRGRERKARRKEASLETHVEGLITGEEKDPGKVGRVRSLIRRITGRDPLTEKAASYAVRRRILTGKVPSTSIDEYRDLGRTLMSQERRMRVEGGKSPVVSKRTVWKKYTAKGGRSSDVKDTLARNLTYHRPAGDQPGVKTVQFKSKP